MNEDVTNSQKDWEDFWNSKPDGTEYTKEEEEKEHLLNTKSKYYFDKNRNR